LTEKCINDTVNEYHNAACDGNADPGGGNVPKMRKIRQLPFASGTLVAINIIVFLVCTFTGNLLYNIGRLDIQGVLMQREYGRIIWSLFLHGDINHIFNNMVILFFLGAMIEKEIGHSWLLLAYLLSGIGGNLVSLAVKIMNADMVGSIGASGAIFGLDGVLLALILFSGKRMPDVTPIRVILMIVLSIYNGFSGANVDNGAHLGGLFTGFLIGIIICIKDRIKELF
jgi:rhomboid protease GluP